MPSFHAALSHPVFACWFQRVHPLFWLVLYWHIGRIYWRMMEGGLENVLVAVYWWGRIDIIRTGERVSEPSVFRPLAPLRPGWDNPLWESRLPAVNGAVRPGAPQSAFDFLHAAGGGCSLRMAGAQTPVHNTS